MVALEIIAVVLLVLVNGFPAMPRRTAVQAPLEAILFESMQVAIWFYSDVSSSLQQSISSGYDGRESQTLFLRVRIRVLRSWQTSSFAVRSQVLAAIRSGSQPLS